MREVLYIGSADEHVYCIDCATGDLIWRFGGKGGFGSTPAFHNDVVYIGGWDGYVYALNAYTGKEVWKYKTGGDIESSPCVENERVYIGSTDSIVYCLTLDGAFDWGTITGYKIESTPSYVNGHVVIGSEDGRIYAINKLGNVEWIVDTGDEVRSSAVHEGGNIYIGSSNKLLYKLDERTGDIIWTSKLHGPTDSTPTISNGRVFIGSIKRNHSDSGEGNIEKRKRCLPSPGAVQAIDINTGEQLWKFLTGDSVWCKPAVNNRLVYISCHDSYIYALNEQTGQCMWKYRCDSYSNSSPTVGQDGTVYVGADDCKVHALDGITGKKKWEYVGTSRFGSSPTVISFVDFPDP